MIFNVESGGLCGLAGCGARTPVLARLSQYGMRGMQFRIGSWFREALLSLDATFPHRNRHMRCFCIACQASAAALLALRGRAMKAALNSLPCHRSQPQVPATSSGRLGTRRSFRIARLARADLPPALQDRRMPCFLAGSCPRSLRSSSLQPTRLQLALVR